MTTPTPTLDSLPAEVQIRLIGLYHDTLQTAGPKFIGGRRNMDLRFDVASDIVALVVQDSCDNLEALTLELCHNYA